MAQKPKLTREESEIFGILQFAHEIGTESADRKTITFTRAQLYELAHTLTEERFLFAREAATLMREFYHQQRAIEDAPTPKEARRHDKRCKELREQIENMTLIHLED